MKELKKQKQNKNQKSKSSQCVRSRGVILSGTLVLSMISIAIVIALTSWFAVVLESSRTLIAREQAFQMAEAGVEYYRWHLAHDDDDFFDGTGEDPDGEAPNGPYVHEVEDKDGNIIGHFSLEITEPPVGTTLVRVTSTGTVVSMPDVSRTISVQLAKPSFAKYAFASDSDMRFGEGTEVFGPIHSNGGIRFDGLAHNVVSSALATYDDPDHGGAEEFGVHTHVSPTDPLPPSEVPERLDVFEAGREFPAPAIDFAGMVGDLASLKAKAQEPEGHYFADSGRQGYLIELNADDTFDLYRVRRLRNVPDSSCTNTQDDNTWGTWSIGTGRNATQYMGEYDFPENGVVFLEDNVWVEGQIDEARITIAAGKFPDIPSNRRSITINNDLLYTNYDGSDVVALIAQENINIGLYSQDDLRIDAALVAQNGRIGRYYYRPPYGFFIFQRPGCSPYHERDTVTLYGMIGTYLRYGFAYSDGTGYETRNINYDGNLLYGPPPEFPLTSDQYEPISWEEVIN
jgi:hypothetical protein